MTASIRLRTFLLARSQTHALWSVDRAAASGFVLGDVRRDAGGQHAPNTVARIVALVGPEPPGWWKPRTRASLISCGTTPRSAVPVAMVIWKPTSSLCRFFISHRRRSAGMLPPGRRLALPRDPPNSTEQRFVTNESSGGFEARPNLYGTGTMSSPNWRASSRVACGQHRAPDGGS
jgi:hypothetical protein